MMTVSTSTHQSELYIVSRRPSSRAPASRALGRREGLSAVVKSRSAADQNLPYHQVSHLAEKDSMAIDGAPVLSNAGCICALIAFS
jgi:hypothetical protein